MSVSRVGRLLGLALTALKPRQRRARRKALEPKRLHRTKSACTLHPLTSSPGDERSREVIRIRPRQIHRRQHLTAGRKASADTQIRPPEVEPASGPGSTDTTRSPTNCIVELASGIRFTKDPTNDPACTGRDSGPNQPT